MGARGSFGEVGSDGGMGTAGRVGRAWTDWRAGPARVIGIVGTDHPSTARAGDEGPALEGLETVVEVAQWIELVEAGVLGLGELDAVIVLGLRAVTPQHRALLEVHRRASVCTAWGPRPR